MYIIYIIITASIFSECEIRKNKYIKCINNLNNIIKENNIYCCIIIIVEMEINYQMKDFYNYPNCY